MFHPYFELGGRIRKHYFAPSVFLSLLSGEFVPPIPRRTLYSLQYSMLPAERTTVSELWERLNENKLSAHMPNGLSSLNGGRGIPNGNSRKTSSGARSSMKMHT
jgi:phosphatidylinositol glycan class Q protein